MAAIAKPVVPWMGGKQKLLLYIRQVFPPDPKEYLEAFSGAGSVLLDLQPKATRLDIYNDYNLDLVNLHVCIRDRPYALIREMGSIIHSRALFEAIKDRDAHQKLFFENLWDEMEALKDQEIFAPELAKQLMPALREKAKLFDVTRAATFFWICRGSFSGTANSFGVKICDVCRYKPLILEANKRLQKVVIENKDALEIIRERRNPEGIVYCDPPYYNAERCYEQLFFRHQELHDLLAGHPGYVVLSYNRCDTILNMYRDFFTLAFKRSNSLAQRKNAEYGELIITNYDPRPYMAMQTSLFGPDVDITRDMELINIPEFELRDINLRNLKNC